MMCQGGFIRCNGCIGLVVNTDGGGGCACVRRGVCGNSVLSAEFCREPKTALKIVCLFLRGGKQVSGLYY